MKEIQRVISQHPFFEGIDEWYLEQLARYAKFETFAPNDSLIRECGEADKFFLILEGEVLVGSDTGDGEFSRLQILKDKDILGWSWLIPPHCWHYDAIANKETKTIVLDAKYLRMKCEEDPKMGYEILKRLTHFIVQRLLATRLQLVVRS